MMIDSNKSIIDLTSHIYVLFGTDNRPPGVFLFLKGWEIVPWGKTSHKKNWFLSGISQITSPPNSGKLYNFFGCQKRRFSTYYKTNDYDNDGSDNCDYNFGTFDNFGVKNDQKVSHNMILMSRYMGQLHGGRGPTNSGKSLPHPFQAMPERNRFFSVSCSLTLSQRASLLFCFVRERGESEEGQANHCF